MIPKEKVEAIVSKHNSIEKELSSGNIDPKKFAEKSKEYSELGNILKNAISYLNFSNEKKHDKYDGVILSYCRSIPLLKKYPRLIASNLGNELVSYVINFNNTDFLKDVNSSIMILKNNLELQRICNSFYNQKSTSPVCSLT